MEQMHEEYLTTRELADLLRIKERKVYDLASNGEVPCVRIVGKLLFPRDEVNAWINSGRSGPAELGPLPLIFAGSHDPLLEWALRNSECGLAAYFDGSHDGLSKIESRQAMACGLHIHERDGWNSESVRKQLGTFPVALIEFAKRQRGLVVAAGNPLKISDLGGVATCRFAKRQESAASQSLFEELANIAGIDVKALAGPSAPARTEDDLARAVLEGKADVAFGLETSAKAFGLGFVPIIQERFDLLVWHSAWFSPQFQKLMKFLNGEEFQTRAKEMGGYDTLELGTVHFNEAN